MPILGVQQPEIIQINRQLRLRKYDGVFDFALEWYQDTQTVYLVDGVQKTYDEQLLADMYEYLNDKGELYFIESFIDGMYKPIGDVTFSQTDMPIVIGDKNFRSKGIGKKVISTLIDRGKKLDYAYLCIREIFDYNTASIKLFEELGFTPLDKTANGHSYILQLK